MCSRARLRSVWMSDRNGLLAMRRSPYVQSFDVCSWVAPWGQIAVCPLGQTGLAPSPTLIYVKQLMPETQLIGSLFAALGLLLSTIASGHALRRKRRPQSAVGWIAVCY